MSWNRLLPAALAVLTLAAGCAGGSSTSSLSTGITPGVDTAPVTTTHHFATASAPTASIKKIDDAVGGGTGGSSEPTWQFVEPLNVSDSAAFTAAANVTVCSPIDPIFGQWYVALNSFTAPLSNVYLPVCTIATPAPTKWNLSSKRTAGVIQTPSPGPYSNLYITELTVGFWSISLTPVAGPAYVTPSGSWYFPALQPNLSFQKDTLYSFFVASYGGTGTPSPISI
jgi:hypothetical protein